MSGKIRVSWTSISELVSAGLSPGDDPQICWYSRYL